MSNEIKFADESGDDLEVRDSTESRSREIQTDWGISQQYEYKTGFTIHLHTVTTKARALAWILKERGGRGYGWDSETWFDDEGKAETAFDNAIGANRTSVKSMRSGMFTS